MVRNEDQDTRYYIDLDLKNKKIINWDYANRKSLSQELAKPFCQRVFITKGQYNKLEKKEMERIKFNKTKTRIKFLVFILLEQGKS